MNYYSTVPLLCCIILIIILYIKLKNKEILLKQSILKQNELESIKLYELKDYFKEEWEKEEKRLDQEKELNNIKIKNHYESNINKYCYEIEKLKIQFKEKEQRYSEINQDLNLYKEGKTKEIDSSIAEYRQHKQIIIKEELKQYRNEWTDKFNNELAKISKSKDKALEELAKITEELEAERSKRAAINEEIRRQREVEMQQDFYRIHFNDEDKRDVETLRSIAPQLRHPEAINKVIWNVYYQKPLAELRKRVAIESSGIYKITRIKTGEIYIGQARNVSTRFAEHCKTALGVGNLASSQLHKTMSQDGCENFLFELLEKTPIEKLKERESYYIDFYDSKKYGLNSISGIK